MEKEARHRFPQQHSIHRTKLRACSTSNKFWVIHGKVPGIMVSRYFLALCPRAHHFRLCYPNFHLDYEIQARGNNTKSACQSMSIILLVIHWIDSKHSNGDSGFAVNPLALLHACPRASVGKHWSINIFCDTLGRWSCRGCGFSHPKYCTGAGLQIDHVALLVHRHNLRPFSLSSRKVR